MIIVKRKEFHKLKRQIEENQKNIEEIQKDIKQIIEKESKDKWYQLPNFPDYEITLKGNVRNIQSKEPIPIEIIYANKKAVTKYVNLNGTNQTIKSLLDSIKNNSENKQSKESKEWYTIPGFSNYEINTDGKIRNKNNSNEQEYSSINNAAKQIQQEIIQKNIEPMVVSSYHRHIKEVLNEDKLFAGRYWRTIDK